MKAGTLFYRCRSCGEKIEVYGVTDLEKTLISIIEIGHDNDEGRITRLHDRHHCGGDSYGITDLIGGKLDQIRTEETNS